MLAAPRLVYSLAEHRLLPQWFGHIHPRYATPDRCIVLMGALALFLALTGSFVKLAVASSVARLLAYVVCIASLPAIRKKADEETRRQAYRLPGSYAIPLLGFLICVWLLTHSTTEAWIGIGVLLAVGIALYFVEQKAT